MTVSLPYRFGSGTFYEKNFFKQLQADLTAAETAFNALQADVAAIQGNVPPYGQFVVNLNGVNQTVSAGVNNKIQFTTELLDADNIYDNATNYRYQPLKSGWYFIYVRARATLSGTDGTQALIYKTGALYAEGTYVASATGANHSEVTALINLNGSTDYIEGWVYSPSVTLRGSTSATEMGGWRVA